VSRRPGRASASAGVARPGWVQRLEPDSHRNVCTLRKTFPSWALARSPASLLTHRPPKGRAFAFVVLRPIHVRFVRQEEIRYGDFRAYPA
jgi:hypothetical protein